MSYSKFIFRYIFPHSPYRAAVLLASALQLHTNFINKSIYNALPEQPCVGCKPNKCNDKGAHRAECESMTELHWPGTKVHIFVLGFVYLTRWLLA